MLLGDPPADVEAPSAGLIAALDGPLDGPPAASDAEEVQNDDDQCNHE